MSLGLPSFGEAFLVFLILCLQLALPNIESLSCYP
jgi:hypothetical protein